MGYQHRVQVFDVAASPTEKLPETKWPLHRTFWTVAIFCTFAWAAIIGVAIVLF